MEMTFEHLQKIAGSNWARKTLVSAVELEIFDKIKNGLNTVDMITKDVNATTSRGVERLLNACASMGFLKKEKDVFYNTELSEKYLIKEHPDYFGDFIVMTDKLSEKWKNLSDAILKGEVDEGEMTDFNDPIFTKAMHNNAVGPAKVLGERVDFSKFNNLLDLGGGSGAYSIELTNKYPKLKATVLELEGVCKTADEYIKKLGDGSKVKTLCGDLLNDEYPKNHDVILFSQILHSYNIENCKKIIKKSYDILPENGMIIINEFILNPDKAGPVFPALFSINMFISNNEGSAYTQEEITSWMTKVGFKDISVIPLVGPHTAVVGKK
ncbi:hypothetical protein GOV12_07595 [Candidatus Pacearchaeota archaeon]|nr:hypothetical protein [Candidatus Pacearchaeota archaeon]